VPVLIVPPTGRPEYDMRALVEVVSPAITYGDAQGASGSPGIRDAHSIKYWRDLQLRVTFDGARRRLKELVSLPQDWDTYDAPPPSAHAKEQADRVLDLLQTLSQPLTKVVASAEGGIGICFVVGDRYADIECLNSGEILAVTYRGSEEPFVWQVESRDAAVIEAIERIHAHFAA
jgi:hypothetical protein